MYPISIIAAIGMNKGLSRNNKLLWNIPEDLANFFKVTRCKPVIMGRKTYESIGKLLPNRHNIIISSQDIDGVCTVRTPEEAVKQAEKYLDTAAMPSGIEREIVVIGGSSVFKAFEKAASKVYLTVVRDDKPADTWFDDSFLFGSDAPADTWKIMESAIHTKPGTPSYTYTVYEKTQQTLAL